MLLMDLELWLTETQATIATEIKLTSKQAVKDQLRASQVRTYINDLFIQEKDTQNLVKQSL